MRHDYPQFKLRIPTAIKAAIAASAAENERSLNAEIAVRLEKSLRTQVPAGHTDLGWLTTDDLLAELRRRCT